MPSTRLHLARTALPLLLALLVLSACMSDLPPSGPGSDIGVVEGRVRESGVGLPAQVEFACEDTPQYARLMVVADSTGWYRAELPTGLYQVRLYLDHVAGGRYVDTDTIVVGRCVRRRDIERTRGRVTVALPPEFEHQTVSLALVGRDCRSSAMATVTDGVAAFDLRLLPCAKYVMRFSPPFRSEPFYLPSTYVSAAADTLDATHGPASHAFDLSASAARISGHVAAGQVRAGRLLYIEAVNALGRVVSYDWIEGEGNYDLWTFVPEPMRIDLRSGDVENWFGGGRWANATVFDLQPGQHVEDVDFNPGGISVRFVGPGDLVPAYHGLVLRREDGSELDLGRRYENPVVVPNLPPGSYRLYTAGTCDGDPWQSQWYPAVADSGDAVPVVVEAGSMNSVDMRLAAGGSIAGTFAGENASHWFTHAVTLQDADGRDLCGGSVYMYYGAFSFGGLPDGAYRLSLAWSGGRYWYPGTFDQAQATPLVISGGNAITGLVWMNPSKSAEAQP